MYVVTVFCHKKIQNDRLPYPPLVNLCKRCLVEACGARALLLGQSVGEKRTVVALSLLRAQASSLLTNQINRASGNPAEPRVHNQFADAAPSLCVEERIVVQITMFVLAETERVCCL